MPWGPSSVQRLAPHTRRYLTFISVPTPSPLPPVAPQGLGASLVHAIATAGHVRAVPAGAGQAELARGIPS